MKSPMPFTIMCLALSKMDEAQRDERLAQLDAAARTHISHPLGVREVTSDGSSVEAEEDFGNGGGARRMIAVDKMGGKVLFLSPATYETEVVLDGFAVPSENYHNFANGLHFGPDGWLYGRCGASCPGERHCGGGVLGARVRQWRL